MRIIPLYDHDEEAHHQMNYLNPQIITAEVVLDDSTQHHLLPDAFKNQFSKKVTGISKMKRLNDRFQQTS